MATTVQLARSIRAALTERSDATYREQLVRLVPTSGPLIGIRVPVLREMARQFAAEHAELTPMDMCALMDELSAKVCREEMLFGTFLLARIARTLAKPGLSDQAWRRIDAWIHAVDNWETCDQLATGLAAPIVAMNPGLVDTLVLWARDANPWRRRFAAATGAALNQKGRSMTDATLRICGELMTDPDTNVVKAVGWALREASAGDATAIATFLARWRAKASPRLMRESSEKLPAATRAALLAAEHI